MLTTLGIALVLTAGGAPVAAPQPLEPAVEARIAFATDRKAMSKLRGADVVARFRPVIALAEIEKTKDVWWFDGRAAQGPVALAMIRFEGQPTFERAVFRLRSKDQVGLHRAVARRLQARLGKPIRDNGDDGDAARSTYWWIAKEWEVSVVRQESLGVDLVVMPWHEPDPEEWDP